MIGLKGREGLIGQNGEGYIDKWHFFGHEVPNSLESLIKIAFKNRDHSNSFNIAIALDPMSVLFLPPCLTDLGEF